MTIFAETLGAVREQAASMTDEEFVASINETIKEHSDEVSDGYHTFQELYDHRNALFIALLKCNKTLAWRSHRYHDGHYYDGWFVAGMFTPGGMITYHLPDKVWDKLDGIIAHEKGMIWDGHTSADVLKRLYQFSENTSWNMS